MSGDQAATLWLLGGVAAVVVAIIAVMSWAADQAVTRGRR